MVTDPSYLFNVTSLNYAISHSDFTASYSLVTVHKVLERMWKEAVEPWFKVKVKQSRYRPGVAQRVPGS
jgi:hypothetical protein